MQQIQTLTDIYAVTCDIARPVVMKSKKGDRWVDARILHGLTVGFAGALLELEQGLRGRSVLVAVASARVVAINDFCLRNQAMLVKRQLQQTYV